MTSSTLLWTPSAERIAQANLTDFTRRASATAGRPLADYHALWQWSIDDRPAFWNLLWDYAGVIGTRGERTLVDGDRMPGARWYPDASLNYAENLLSRRAADDKGDALVFRGEDKVAYRVSHAELVATVSRVAAALRAEGVGPGDRVAAYLPNMPEAYVAMLATTSLGAIWSSCSPDFGVRGVVDRFSQIEPKVLFTVDGYWYNGKPQPLAEKLPAIVGELPSVRRVVVVPYLGRDAGTPIDVGRVRDLVSWDAFIAPHPAQAIRYARMPFAHPIYILYSSGTTGVPKCIVHSAGGTLLQHMKEHLLHADVRPGDRLFFFTTCGWMMWNWLASALASRATLLLFDGSPFVGRGRVLWDLAEEERMTQFGTSAKYIDALAKTGLVPRESYKLEALRTLLSTGSPLAPEGFDYIYRAVKDDLCLSSISGGTRHHRVLRARRSDAARLARRAAMPRAGDGHRRPSTTTASPFAARRRARLHEGVSVDADRLLERSGRRQVSRRLLRAVSEHLVARRLRRADRARRHDHLRSLRFDAPTPAACASGPPRSTGRSSSRTKWRKASSSDRIGHRVRWATCAWCCS
jgi:acetoacetyl-CoA synthetase